MIEKHVASVATIFLVGAVCYSLFASAVNFYEGKKSGQLSDKSFWEERLVSYLWNVVRLAVSVWASIVLNVAGFWYIRQLFDLAFEFNAFSITIFSSYFFCLAYCPVGNEKLMQRTFYLIAMIFAILFAAISIIFYWSKTYDFILSLLT